jgi:hypothetical protein
MAYSANFPFLVLDLVSKHRQRFEDLRVIATANTPNQESRQQRRPYPVALSPVHRQQDHAALPADERHASAGQPGRNDAPQEGNLRPDNPIEDNRMNDNPMQGNHGAGNNFRSRRGAFAPAWADQNGQRNPAGV